MNNQSLRITDHPQIFCRDPVSPLFCCKSTIVKLYGSDVVSREDFSELIWLNQSGN